MVELGVGEHDALHRYVARLRGARGRKRRDLLAHVGRRVQKEPASSIGAHCDGRLRTGVRTLRRLASGAAGRTPAVPLRESAARGGSQKRYAHTSAEPEKRKEPGVTGLLRFVSLLAPG